MAWDFLASAIAGPDRVGCDQVAALQADATRIIDTNVHYFGDYLARGPGGKRIDILTYNVVDEAYYDPDATTFTAGFYAAFYQEQFNRNIFFLDSAPWSYGLGADAEDPFLVEGIFAHELEHLIMNDHDPDELSWIDEGLAELAIYLNGYADASVYTSSIAYYLAFHREDSLTMWGSQLWDYGASSLFQLYLLENFGSQAYDGSWNPAWTRRMMNTQANGIAGVRRATGEDFDTLFDAWILANLQDKPNQEAAGGYPMGYGEVDTNPIVDPFLGPWSVRRSLRDIYPPPTNDPGEALPYSAVYAAFRDSQAGDVDPVPRRRGLGDPGTRRLVRGLLGGCALADRPDPRARLAGRRHAHLPDMVQHRGGVGLRLRRGLHRRGRDVGAARGFESPGRAPTRTSRRPGRTRWAGPPRPTLPSRGRAAVGSTPRSTSRRTRTSSCGSTTSRTRRSRSTAGTSTTSRSTGSPTGSSRVPAPGPSGAGRSRPVCSRTTGIGAYVNPIKGEGFEAGYLDGTVGAAGYERFSTVLDTHRAGDRKVIVAIANRPETDAADGGFPAGYRRVVEEV